MLSQWAYEHSSLAATDNQLLVDLGLMEGPSSASPTFNNSLGTKNQTIVKLISFGAEFEDSGRRPLNLFYDPQNSGRSLTAWPLSISSPNWALEDTENFVAQNYSLLHATDYLYKALTQQTKTYRETYWVLTFQSLGQVVHHIQDMAQPQHVRNDDHCKEPYCLIAGPILYRKSMYEKYTAESHSSLANIVSGSTYPPIDLSQFNNAKAFWDGSDSSDGFGLAM